MIGTTGGRGERTTARVLHFGLRVGDTYVDPMQLFAPPDLAAVVHLGARSGPTAAGGVARPLGHRGRAVRRAVGCPTAGPVPSRRAPVRNSGARSGGRTGASGPPLYPR